MRQWKPAFNSHATDKPMASNSRSNWNLEMLVFEKGGKTGVPGEKTFVARTRTNNKLNPHMTPSSGIEPGPHWWETRALTTASFLLPDLKGDHSNEKNCQQFFPVVLLIKLYKVILPLVSA